MTVVLDPTPTPAQPLADRDARLGPLLFPTVEGQLKESLGDALETVGAIAIPGERRPRPFSLQLPVHGMPSDGPDYLVQGDRLRAQVRALIENPKARLQGLWFQFDPDHVVDGWLLIGGADLSYTEEGTTFADYLLELTDCYRIGDRHTHRPARLLQARDRRLSTEPRDTLGRIRSTDFASLPALARYYLPPGVDDPVGVAAPVIPQPLSVPTADGVLSMMIGRQNSDVVSYEQAAADEYRAGVLVRDRKGAITAPPTGPDAAWEDVYGPVQALTAGDVPVIENGRCRVRYDPDHTPGFTVDAWDGDQWVEQGKVTAYRFGDGFGWLATLLSATVREWTPERAVIQAVMRFDGIPSSRERILITLQRGWTGPRIEGYWSPNADGSSPLNGLMFSFAGGGDASAFKLDAGNVAGGRFTAGSGSPLWPVDSSLGAATFTGENFVTALRQGATHALQAAVVRASVTSQATSSLVAYGVQRNALTFFSSSPSTYTSVQLGFHAVGADQIWEAEGMTLGAGTTSVADAAASGGNAAQATNRTADGVHVSKAAWLNDARGLYRIFARVKTTASTLNVYAKVGAEVTAAVRTASGAYTWVDLSGFHADGSTLEIHAWTDANAQFHIDRIEAHKLEDRLADAQTYDGGRDLGQAVLMDCRQLQRLAPR